MGMAVFVLSGERNIFCSGFNNQNIFYRTLFYITLMIHF